MKIIKVIFLLLFLITLIPLVRLVLLYTNPSSLGDVEFVSANAFYREMITFRFYMIESVISVCLLFGILIRYFILKKKGVAKVTFNLIYSLVLTILMLSISSGVWVIMYINGKGDDYGYSVPLVCISAGASVGCQRPLLTGNENDEYLKWCEATLEYFNMHKINPLTPDSTSVRAISDEMKVSIPSTSIAIKNEKSLWGNEIDLCINPEDGGYSLKFDWK